MLVELFWAEFQLCIVSALVIYVSQWLCQVIGSCQFYGGYIIDSVGWPLIAYNPALSDGWQIPAYPHRSHLNYTADVLIFNYKKITVMLLQNSILPSQWNWRT